MSDPCGAGAKTLVSQAKFFLLAETYLSLQLKVADKARINIIRIAESGAKTLVSQAKIFLARPLGNRH